MVTHMNENYIDLNRTLEPFDESGKTDDDSSVNYRFKGWRGTRKRWDEVLTSHRLLVVLAEAGSGKTVEFRTQAAISTADGEVRFFIRLDELIMGDINTALNDHDSARFQEFLVGAGEGIFFLDALDEARLVRANEVRIALRKLVAALRPAQGRVRVILSSRVSDWRPQEDKVMVEEILGSLFPGTNQQQEPREKAALYSLSHLDEKQQRRYAQGTGLADADTFMKAVIAEGLDELAVRPLDLDGLVRYWQSHGTFGTRREMLEENLRFRLDDPNQDRKDQSGLSLNRLRQGAETLAACCVLCGLPTIAAGGAGASTLSEGSILIPEEALPNWTPDEIKALVTRPLFDPATYGRVRFHHRMVREYLAACWLAQRIESGRSLNVLFDLFFQSIDGRILSRPALRGVLGWMAATLPNWREVILRHSPFAALFRGDPAVLTEKEKIQALIALEPRLPEEINSYVWSDAEVRPLATPAMEPTVLCLVGQGTDNWRMWNLLMGLVRLGRYSSCCDSILDFLTAPSSNRGDYDDSIAAVAAAGNADQVDRLLTFAREGEGVDNRLLANCCWRLFPRWIDVATCMEIARRGDINPHVSTDKRSLFFLKLIVRDCPPKLLAELFLGLYKLVTGGSKQGHWALAPLGPLFVRILEEIPKDHWPVPKMAIIFHALSESGKYNTEISRIGELNQALKKHLDLRRDLYWDLVKRDRRQNPTHNAHWSWEPELLSFDVEDVPWLLQDARKRRDPYFLRTAFQQVIGLWHQQGRPNELRDEIAAALRIGNKPPDIVLEVERDLAPPSLDEPDWKRRRKEQDERREQEKKEALSRFRDTLSRNLEKIRKGEDIDALVGLYARIPTGESFFSWTRTDLESLTSDFGPEIIHAARKGFRAAWKLWYPPLPSEQKDKRHKDPRIIVGLCGLAIEVEAGFDWHRTPASLVTSAAHYALYELNNFPDWFEPLALAHPGIVQPILLQEAKAELHDDTAYPHVLNSLQRSSQDVQQGMIPLLLKLLEAGDLFSGNKALENTCVILMRARDEPTRIRVRTWAAFYAGTTFRTGIISQQVAALAFWLRLDGQTAWKFVEQRLVDDPHMPHPLLFDLAAHFGEVVRYTSYQKDAGKKVLMEMNFLQPALLSRMIPVFYQHVPPHEDINRANTGVYTPGPQDHAQEFRGWLVKELATLPDPTAQHVLWQLSETLDGASTQAWLKYLALDRAGREIEFRPWHPADVVAFACPLPPTSPMPAISVSLDYGPCYALVIGVDKYVHFSQLKAAVHDAQAMEKLLKERFGFKTKLLKDPQRNEIERAFADCRAQLKATDNLLIYFAGHGQEDKKANTGCWCPVDAELDGVTNYIYTDWITRQVRAMEAKHILVVADACFPAKLYRGGTTPDSDKHYVTLAKKKARLALVSGGLEQVCDGGGSNGHSVFAGALMDVLSKVDSIISGHELFSQVRGMVVNSQNQLPEYAPLHDTGHDGGDFLFIRN